MPLVQERLKKLEAVISGMTGSCSILIAQVDPDAIGSAVALAHFIMRRKPGNGLKIKMFYGGSVSHPQNQALINRFDLFRRMKPMKQFTSVDNKNVVLVDSSSASDARLGTAERLDPVMVIDHHRGGDVLEREDTFVHIEDVGATSTLVAELFQTAGVPLSDEHSVMSSLLLAVGIYSDTGGLTDCTRRDREAYGVLADAVPNQDLVQLYRYPLPPSHFTNVRTALANMEMRDGKLVTHVGKVEAKEGDDLSTIADELIRMTGVTLVVVWGILSNERVVRLSARNSDISSPLDLFLRERFPAGSCGAKLSSDGRGIGGGTVSLELGPWMIAETEGEVIALVSKWVKTRVFGK